MVQGLGGQGGEDATGNSDCTIHGCIRDVQVCNQTCNPLRRPPARAKREPLETFQGLLPESHGQNGVLTVLCVPYFLYSLANTSEVMSVPLSRQYGTHNKVQILAVS